MERCLFTKLLTGGFRVGISAKLLTRALGLATGTAPDILTHRLMGDWTPASTSFAALIAADGDSTSRPYPFALAHPLEDLAALGPATDWATDWKWARSRPGSAKTPCNGSARSGPVRQVAPVHVFEIAFEGIQASPRHKSGIALRFPRISRWRHDKAADQANTIADLQQILAQYG